MRISDWSSDVCSSDLEHGNSCLVVDDVRLIVHMIELDAKRCRIRQTGFNATTEANAIAPGAADTRRADLVALIADAAIHASAVIDHQRSEEHTSELQSLMRIHNAVFCLKQNNKT